MFYCRDCKGTFEEPKKKHMIAGFGFVSGAPLFNTQYFCPHCNGSDFVSSENGYSAGEMSSFVQQNDDSVDLA